MFRTFGAAGDAGITAGAATLGGLLSEMARGLYRLSSRGAPRPERTRKLSLRADSPASLLVNFLNELIFLLDTEGFLAASVDAEARPARGGWELRAVLKGETGAFKKRPRGLLVKAATYHGVEAAEKNGRWRGKVLLDI